MNRKTFIAASLGILMAVSLVGHAASIEARALHSFKTCAPEQTVVAVPANVLTGAGAIATPDGVLHF